MKVKFSDQEILVARKRLETRYSSEDDFIAYGSKIVNLTNFCSAFHRKNFKLSNGAILNHEDYAPEWTLTYPNGIIKYFYPEDVLTYKPNTGECSVTEVWKNYEIFDLIFTVSRFYDRKEQRKEGESLTCSEL